MLDAKRKSPAVGRELGLAQKPARVVSDLPFMKRPGRGALYSVNVVEAPPPCAQEGSLPARSIPDRAGHGCRQPRRPSLIPVDTRDLPCIRSRCVAPVSA